MKSSLFCLASTLLFASGAEAAITTEYLAANGLNFTCTILKQTSPDSSAPIKEVVLLHGFPMFRVWWDPLLEHWDNLAVSVHAVACDLRGYSPGASPDSIEEYDYSIFAEDAFALAKAAGFDQGFELFGHDHGALLAWYIAQNDPNNLIRSLTTFSVPHSGLLSNALCGNNTDEEQVIASNYFNQFSLSDSAFQNDEGLTRMFQGFGLALSPTQFQKMLWWYNGSLGKHFSMPRVVSDAEVEEYASTVSFEDSYFLKASRTAIPMAERPCTLVDKDDSVSPIAIPTLFVCGVDDYAVLCNHSYATDFPSELIPDYEHANYQCKHDFFLDGNCDSMEESRAVMNKVTSFLFGTGGNDKAEKISAGSSGDGEAAEGGGDEGAAEGGGDEGVMEGGGDEGAEESGDDEGATESGDEDAGNNSAGTQTAMGVAAALATATAGLFVM